MNKSDSLKDSNEELKKSVRRQESSQEIEDRHQDLLGHIKAVQYTHDLQGQLLSVNQEITEFLGYDKNFLLNMNIRNLLAPEVRHEFDTYLTEMKRQGNAKGLMLVQTAIGEKRILIYNNTLQTEGVATPTVQGIAYDITKYIQTERALRQVSGQLSIVLESLPIVCYIGKAEGDYGATYITHNIKAITGFEDTNFTSKSSFWADRIHPEDAPRIFANLPQIFEKGYHEHQYRWQVADGSYKWFYDYMRVILSSNGKKCIIGMMQDITERKRAEEALLNAAQQWRTTFDGISDFVSLLDLDGKILRCNKAMKDFVGKPFNEIINHSCWEIILGTTTPIEDCPFLRMKETLHRETTILSVNDLWFNVSVDPIFDQASRLIGAVNIISDITKRKQAEEAVTKLSQENAIVAEIGRIISSTLNIEDVYERFAEEVRKFIHFDRISVSLINCEKNTASVAYGSGGYVQGLEVGDEFPLTGSAAEWVMRTRSGLLIQTESEAEVARISGLLKIFQASHRSMIVVPLISKDIVIGVLFLGSTRPNSYTDYDLKLAESIGNQIAGAIANAQLFTELKRSEEAIKQERETFFTMLDKAPYGAALIDTDERYLYLNPEFTAITGYTLEDIPTRKEWLQKAYPDPAYRQKAIETWRKKFDYREVKRIFSVVCKSSEVRVIEFRPNLLKDGRTLLMLSDITELKRSEEALRQSEEITRTLFSISNAVNTTRDLDELYRSIHQSLGRIIDTTNFYIALYNKEEDSLHIPYFVDAVDDLATDYSNISSPNSNSHTAIVIKTGKPVLHTKEDFLKYLSERNLKPGMTLSKIWLGVPLKIKNEVIGAIVVHSHTNPNLYDERDVDILLAVSDQVALAIERKRAEEALRQSEEINRVLFSISNAVNTTVNLDELYGIIHKSLNQIIDATNFSIALYDHQTQYVTFPYFVYDKTRLPDFTPPQGFTLQNMESSALVGGVLRTGRPLLIKREEMLRQEREEGKKVFGIMPEVWLGVPLKVKNEVIGVMATQSHTDPNRYNEKDVEIFNSVSDQVALAIERKRAEEARRKSEEINHTLFSISNAVNTTVNLDELYGIIHKSLNQIIDVTNFSIALYDHQAQYVTFPYFVSEVTTGGAIVKSRSIAPQDIESSALTGGVLRTGRPLLIKKEEMLRQEREEGKKVFGNMPEIWLGVPLKVKNEVIGVMATQNHTDPNRYNEKDVEIFNSVSDQVALAIDRKRAEEAQRKSENINRILFSISNAVNTTVNLDELYGIIHKSLNQILDVTNFYIALCDHQTQYVTFPYFVYDKINFPDFPLPRGYTMQEMESSALTGGVFRTGRPLLIKKEELLRQEKEEGKKVFGIIPEVWLGVPLKVKNEVIGVMAIQSLTDPNRYNEKDIEIFNSVSDQVALAIERKRAEEALLNAAQQWRFTFDGISDIVCLLDTEGKILRCNKAMVDLLGKPFSEIIDRPHWEIIHGTKAPIQGSPVERMRETRRRETAILSIHDRWFNIAVDPLIDEAGGLIGAIHIMSDITERKQAEEALRTEKQRFQTVSENAPFGMAMIDKTSTYKYINPKFKELFGYDLNDIPDGKTWFSKAFPDPTYRHHVISTWINDTDLAGSKPGEKISRTFTVTCKDGTEKIINFLPVKLEKGEYLTTFVDITLRKKAEDALQRSEEAATRLAQENATVAEIGRIISSTLNIEEVYERFAQELRKLIFVDRVSLCTINPDGCSVTITYIWGPDVKDRNQRDVFSLKGTLVEMVLTKRAGALVAMENEEAVARTHPTLLNTFRAGFRSLMPVPLISKDQVIGALILHASKEKAYTESDLALAERVGNQIAGAIANAQLLIERKRAEEALQKSEEEAKRLAQENAIMAEIGRIISSTLNIEEVYERFAEEVSKLFPVDRISVNIFNLIDHTYTMAYVFGVEVEGRKKGDVPPFKEKFFEEILDKRLSILIQANDEKELAERYPILLSTFRAGLRSMMSIPLISKDQVIGALHFRSTKPNVYAERELRLAERVGNQIAGAIANAQLLTERKQAEEEKEVLQEQLRQSQKMEAIGRLAGGVAHDFNNLLTVVKGYSQISLVMLKEGDPLKENIEEIQKAANRAANLTKQLLVFSRRQILELKVFHLNTILQDLDKMLHRIIGEDIELVYSLSNDLGQVKSDPTQMEQVILNLAINAKDAMPSGGKLTIETSNATLDESYTDSHIGVTPGDYVMLSVSDTGVGMTPEIKERIFEPFFTTKEKEKGTGLGLSIVYGIVQQSGGTIWVYSELGLGTTFKVFLPRIQEDAESLRPTAVPTKSLQGSETILVVEDEEIVRKLACKVLEKNGYRVLEASNGEEALYIVQKQNGNPIHLVVTDVVMPGLSGRQLVDRLVSLWPQTKALYMSGYTNDVIVHHGVLDPGIAYIQKPFTPDDLILKVRKVLDGP